MPSLAVPPCMCCPVSGLAAARGCMFACQAITFDAGAILRLGEGWVCGDRAQCSSPLLAWLPLLTSRWRGCEGAALGAPHGAGAAAIAALVNCRWCCSRRRGLFGPVTPPTHAPLCLVSWIPQYCKIWPAALKLYVCLLFPLFLNNFGSS